MTGVGYDTNAPGDDESYTYDDNGNRIDVANNLGSSSYTTGSNNRLSNDGQYTYKYDGEGNLVARTSSGESTYFTWDQRNRLTSVSFYWHNSLESQTTFSYDAFDRLIGKQTDYGHNEAFVYDGDQIVLRFQHDISGIHDDGSILDTDETNRYLWGPGVDQLLAQESVTSLGSAGTVDWALTDHQNTIRDWVEFDGFNTTVADHVQYDSFGNLLGGGNVDSIFGYTGRYHDADTGLQWNGSSQGGGRWYDSTTGRWLSEDSIGFRGDRSNLYRYVGNGATKYVDPSGRDMMFNCYIAERTKHTLNFVDHYYRGGGSPIDLTSIGLGQRFLTNITVQNAIMDFQNAVKKSILSNANKTPPEKCSPRATKCYTVKGQAVTDVTDDNALFAVGHSTFFMSASVCMAQNEDGTWTATVTYTYSINDAFKDPLDIGIETGGTIYPITWSNSQTNTYNVHF